VTPDERRFYVCGALAPLAQFKASADVVAAAYSELGLTVEDVELCTAEVRASRGRPHKLEGSTVDAPH
jgi:hypothetical protein